MKQLKSLELFQTPPSNCFWASFVGAGHFVSKFQWVMLCLMLILMIQKKRQMWKEDLISSAKEQFI